MLGKNQEIEKIKQILAGKFGINKIFIFGSFAYGNPDTESDIDLCIIADLKNKRKIDFTREIRRELSKHIERPLDLLVYSETEFRERADLQSTLENVIASDGLTLYE
jgi:uncharacterized protein